MPGICMGVFPIAEVFLNTRCSHAQSVRLVFFSDTISYHGLRSVGNQHKKV